MCGAVLHYSINLYCPVINSSQRQFYFNLQKVSETIVELNQYVIVYFGTGLFMHNVILSEVTRVILYNTIWYIILKYR
jgi:hypothetical protein